jgi:hypothetical protein
MRLAISRLLRMANPLFDKQSRNAFLGGNSQGSKSMKSEDYQRNLVFKNTNVECKKINGYRINQRFNYMEIKHAPLKDFYGFDYTEDFDGIQVIGNKKVFVNFKNICGKGGSQTRSMREVYHFIDAQCRGLNNFNNGSILLFDNNGMSAMTDVYFANILDGDVIEQNFDKYKYLFVHYPVETCDRIYVGTSEGYKEWFEKNISNNQDANDKNTDEK